MRNFKPAATSISSTEGAWAQGPSMSSTHALRTSSSCGIRGTCSSSKLKLVYIWCRGVVFLARCGGGGGEDEALMRGFSMIRLFLRIEALDPFDSKPRTPRPHFVDRRSLNSCTSATESREFVARHDEGWQRLSLWSIRTSVSRNAASPLPRNLNSLSDPNSQRNQQNVANINRSSLLFDSSWPKKQNLERLDPLLISQLCFATISEPAAAFSSQVLRLRNRL
jgi:hypothetical protein